jgi:sulfate adenylyltransferase large subunit
VAELQSPEPVELLRFITAGSVDDGKSTLIGRLLYDTKTLFDDQLEHIEDVSRRRGDERTNLALVTDGLRAEREQGITIDVAYRYFSTPRRKFIIADAPGHAQYTRNMVTGASTAELAIVLVDARRGLLEQTRRHTFLAALLGIPQVVFAVNKMDLVEYSEEVFRTLASELQELAERLQVPSITCIPLSALRGDNVVEPSDQMPWYAGPTLLAHLETVPLPELARGTDLRFPVQWVIRPQSDELPDYRGYAGVIAGGTLRAGDPVRVWPSGLTTRVTRVETYDGPLETAVPPLAVTVHVEDAVDLSRGDMLCHPDHPPFVGQDLTATIAWMSPRPLRPGRYALKHTTRWVRALVTEIESAVDVTTLATSGPVDRLELNGIGRVRLRTTSPLFYDSYQTNRTTGSFLLVDESTHETVGAGMLHAPASSPGNGEPSSSSPGNDPRET